MEATAPNKMENIQVQMPKEIFSSLGTDTAPNSSDLKIRLSNDVFDTPKKYTTELTTENGFLTYTQDSTKQVLDVDWSGIQDNLDIFTINVNLLEILWKGSVVKRQFVVIGKDLTMNKWRAEVVN
jgi:hypothetical protein